MTTDPNGVERALTAINAAFSRVAQPFADADAEASALIAASDPEDDDNDLRTLAEHLAKSPPSPMTIALLILKIKSMERVISTRKAASSKNTEARNWVREEWLARTDRLETKDKFATRYAEKVAEKFQFKSGESLKIRQFTIYTVWLKGL